jgi:hypothetical protein
MFENYSLYQFFAKLLPVPLKETVSLMDHELFAFCDFFVDQN